MKEGQIHVLWTKADEYHDLWCPYCDIVVPFGQQYYYEDVWCTKCGRMFPYQHQFPKGFDITTGELENE